MLHYFYLLNRDWMQGTLRPALTESWRQRSFTPCVALCRDLLATRDVADDAIVRHVAAGLRFERALWHALTGECLILGADALPRLEIAFETLRALLMPHEYDVDPVERGAFSPIEQVYLGARDLRFGGWHRPESVGWNDTADVARLASYLRSVDPGTWSAADLRRLPNLTDDAERDEELADARAWWPVLVEMYAGAHAAGQVIVCERV
jgi:hypothetical protein